MHDLIRKPMTVALAAVLLFCSVAPVPTGAAIFDRARSEYAYANPVAGTAAQMALYALQAACIAGGIYIAGTSINEFNVNSQELYDAFTDYYTAQNDISQSELEAILAGSYTNGNIDLSALTAAGITGAIPGFASYLLNDGMAVSGNGSASANVTKLYFGETEVNTVGIDSRIAEYVQKPEGYEVLFIDHTPRASNRNETWIITFVQPSAVRLIYSNPFLNVNAANSSTGFGIMEQNINIGRDSGTIYANSPTVVSSGASSTQFRVVDYGTGSWKFPCSTFPYSAIANASAVSTGLLAGSSAVVADGVTAGTFAGTNQGIVQAFEPTAEQLQAGYDASILQGVEQAVADLGTISTGIAALDATMNGLLGVCQGIASTLSNTVVGQYCAAVTQWLGATPFGTVMGTVIDGLDDIPDAVADGAAVVAGGVAALPGALEGVIEGVLEGVFGQPFAIPGFLQDILAGVQAIPGALEGAIEGITFPEWRWPEAPEIPRVDGEPVPFALSADLIADMQTDLRDKIPFCYLIRIGESLGTLFGNLQTTRSFYFDMDVPVAGSVHFDGESFLNQPLLGSNIADVIRICATALLCTGLLYGAYKVAREL